MVDLRSGSKIATCIDPLCGSKVFGCLGLKAIFVYSNSLEML
jgi:hypothetical protein